MFFAVAAGNGGVDACTSSPARSGSHDGVVSTAATDKADQEASFSNFGQCVDLWAPGVSIVSTKKGGGTTTASGTSMAAPHVGGAGALYLSRYADQPAAAVEQALKTDGVWSGTLSKDGRAIQVIYAGLYQAYAALGGP